MSQVKECLQTQSFECSILPNAIPKACLQKVEKKTCRFENIKACQTLKNQFKYIQPSRRESCKPTLIFISSYHMMDKLKKSNVSDIPFTDDSVYNHSYYHHDVCENRTEPVVHKDHLVMAGQFQDQTSQRMSYPVQCVSMVQKVVPKNNCLGGHGPMRMMTTQKHDYYGPFNYDGLGRSKKIVQSDSLVINSDCPMVGLTTNSCSYQPVYAKREKNFKPNQCYTAPLKKMDLNTTNRSSYKKIEKQEKIRTPWAAKLSYCKPNNTTNYCTMYNYSYKEPGVYTYKDNCGNTANLMVDSNLGMGMITSKNCCPLTCLADNVDSELKSKFTKAHHFDD